MIEWFDGILHPFQLAVVLGLILLGVGISAVTASTILRWADRWR